MMGFRGNADEKTRHIAAAAAWGLFPEWDATYLNYSGNHDIKVGHKEMDPGIWTRGDVRFCVGSLGVRDQRDHEHN
jgi:hypothetical protein